MGFQRENLPGEKGSTIEQDQDSTEPERMSERGFYCIQYSILLAKEILTSAIAVPILESMSPFSNRQ